MGTENDGATLRAELSALLGRLVLAGRTNSAAAARQIEAIDRGLRGTLGGQPAAQKQAVTEPAPRTAPGDVQPGRTSRPALWPGQEPLGGLGAVERAAAASGPVSAQHEAASPDWPFGPVLRVAWPWASRPSGAAVGGSVPTEPFGTRRPRAYAGRTGGSS
jgi:hypothetical protein